MKNSKHITTHNEEITDPEQAVGQARRDFLKTAGKFAVYTPPAVMMLMKPGYARMNKSMTGRPHHHHHHHHGRRHHGGNEDRGHHGKGHGTYGQPS